MAGYVKKNFAFEGYGRNLCQIKVPRESKTTTGLDIEALLL